MDPELRHEAVDDPEEAVRFEEVGVDELLEASRAKRRPVRVNLALQ